VGWNDHMDDGNDTSNLPPEAMGNTFDVEGPFGLLPVSWTPC
jgi:hypothetical protein